MINRQTSRFISRRISGVDCRCAFANWGLMALLNKDPFFAGFRGFAQAGPASEPRSRFPWIKNSILFNLKCCDGYHRWPDDIQKPHTLALNSQLVHKSDARIEDKKDVRLMNGQGILKHGSPLGFPEHQEPEKLVVAVDVDEVLGNFVSALNKFIADRYSSKHSVSEYYVYEFFKIWNCSRDEADIRVHEFFKTSYFKTGIHPIPGARVALHKLSTFCNLSVVTSRQNAIKDHTVEWIEKHYPGLFQEIHFGNHFALDGKSRPKSDICRSLGARVLIDDNPRYAIECADIGIRVLLFDYENSYPWCKTGSATQHPLITKVHNWQEVEQQLVSWITS